MCGYRKGFSTQHALLPLLEKWKRVLDNKGYGRAILLDFSKAFDIINHDLLIVNLHVPGFSKEYLKLIKSYLTNIWERTKLNTGFSTWTKFTENTNVCNYPDDTTVHACDSDLHNLVLTLQYDSVLAI